jgi:hypothetical protein
VGDIQPHSRFVAAAAKLDIFNPVAKVYHVLENFVIDVIGDAVTQFQDIQS